MNLKPEETKILYNLLDNVYNRFGKPDKRKEPYTIYKSDLFKQFNIPERLKQPFFKELEKNFIIVNKNPSNNFKEFQKKQNNPEKVSFKKAYDTVNPYLEYYKTSPISNTNSFFGNRPIITGVPDQIDASPFYKDSSYYGATLKNEPVRKLKEVIYQDFKEQVASIQAAEENIVKTKFEGKPKNPLLKDEVF